jgi:hypothetical protein
MKYLFLFLLQILKYTVGPVWILVVAINVSITSVTFGIIRFLWDFKIRTIWSMRTYTILNKGDDLTPFGPSEGLKKPYDWHEEAMDQLLHIDPPKSYSYTYKNYYHYLLGFNPKKTEIKEPT